MSNNETMVLLIAAKQGYDEGKLNGDQYLSLLDDIENGVIVAETKKIEQQVEFIIKQYANL
ncbi:hypothetical protein [Aquimarina algiphila]|uniref:Uncharacterized protein n=1 Tax=Aquimarina algiphila TaxID=2047982 RepID=A0A554VEH4_9FLAO|nr:hypothetical protein [Aquimarina algiphila]TSE05427.1 hypothetical protein FOF46_22960 [Aquimarina algiphila]